MTGDSAHIRRFEDADGRLVRLIIGKAALEPLAVANRWGYAHPIFLSVWLALSMALVQCMNWWPSQGLSFLRFLSPLPAFAAMAVPLMFFVDWFNRNDFEDRAQEILRRQDAADFAHYYSGVPGSGLWIVEYGEKFVGLIAMDAKEDDKKNKKNVSKRVNQATIRHFYVDEPFRSTGIQDDLLAHAIRHTFETSSIVTVNVEGNPLTSYVQKALRSAGFVQGNKLRSIGLFGWQLHEMVLDKARWKEVK
ncbi:hypothetical protein AX15_004831 [Amanita polypyramis BW_CC]|nr:hypothetical protein AX15_004831 [Amanita polypyramis BW_CC]